MRFVLSVLVVLTALAPAQAEEMLRWKLKKGQTLRYRTTIRQLSSTESLGRPADLFEVTTTSEITLRVRNVGDAGVFEVEQTTDRVLLNQVARGENRAFDSKLDGDQGLEKKGAERLRATIGLPALVKMDLRGEIREITWPEEALLAYKNVTGREMPLKGSDRNVINSGSIVRSLPVWFPERAVAAGDSWEFITKAKDARLPNVKLDRITIFRYEGTKEHLARIAVESKAESADGKLGSGIMGSGLIRFDTTAGALHDVETRRSSKDSQLRPNGDAVTITSELQYRCNLIPPDVKSEPNEGKKP